VEGKKKHYLILKRHILVQFWFVSEEVDFTDEELSAYVSKIVLPESVKIVCGDFVQLRRKASPIEKYAAIPRRGKDEESNQDTI